MSITNDRCTSFLQDAVSAWLSGKSFKLALIKTGHAFNYTHAFQNVGTPGTGAPSNTNLGTDEVSGAGYTSGGIALAAPTVTVNGRVVRLDFADPAALSSATLSADGAVIYETGSGKAIGVFLFSNAPVAASNGTFSVDLPAAGDATSLVRIS